MSNPSVSVEMPPKITCEKLPDVSIIILTHNGSKYIETLLESLSDQTYPREKTEIIVVDNASPDNTVSLVRKGYTKVKCVPLEKNMGFAAGNNQGLRHAQNDFLVFLNQDTICHRNWLRGLVKGILKKKSIGVCTSNMLLPTTGEFRTMDRYASLDSLYFFDLSPFAYGKYRKITGKEFVFPRIISGCSFIIRRQTVAELGYLFDEELWMYAEDTDLSLRIHNIGQRICAVRDSVVYHLHDSDVQMKADRLYLAARAIMNRVFVLFKNMVAAEFLFFFPILLFGGAFKLFEFHLSPTKRAVYFLPFAFFSIFCMLLAILRFPRYMAKRRNLLRRRRVKGFHVLRLVFMQHA